MQLPCEAVVLPRASPLGHESARVPSEHVKLPPLGVQLPCEVVMVPGVKPLGQVSVRVIPAAGDGPALLTVIV